MKVHWHGANEALLFDDPEQLISAHAPAGVGEAFRQIENAISAGKYVAGYATYELGHVLVPRQSIPERGTLPLLKLGVYARPIVAPAPAPATFTLGPIVPLVSRDRYERDIANILAGIRDGDVYQVNYSAPFAFDFSGDPYAFFHDTVANGTYPYAAYVEDAKNAIVSFSPELFMKFAPGTITTRPMKGTATRDAAADLQSAKNRAEHVMIVDLLRNDLYRISNRVDVEALWDVEEYDFFSTMTSTIAGQLCPDVSLHEIFQAMFPCGSVTGAPKVAAMQFITKTEARTRGAFCGSIGYLAPDRTGYWNVAIRTATIDTSTGRGHLDVGGGVVADSTADGEWAEILTKSRFITARTPAYALLETLGRQPDGSYPHLEFHLERLAASANALHFPYDAGRIRSALHIVGAPEGAIVRVALSQDGTIDVSTRPLDPITEPVHICWAGGTVDSHDPFLRHKTTWRRTHDAAVQFALANACFDALIVNERGDVCEGGRTTVFVQRGDVLVTPPLESGVLPGILRRVLLESGHAVEGRLGRSDVASAPVIHIGSSARGLLRCTFKADRLSFANDEGGHDR